MIKPRYDIHKYEKRVEDAKRVIKQCEKICPNNKELLLKYADFKRAQGISLGRIAKLLYTLKSVAVKLGKSFKKASKKDWVRVFAEIEASDIYRPNTKRDYKIITRSFIAWLFGMTPKYDGYPEVIKWLRISEPKNQLPKSLVTEKEISQMINATDNLRNKAFLVVLYDSGGRIGEILPLQVGDVEVTQYCARLHVNGKTGERIITIIGAMPFLCAFLDRHPNRDSSEAPLFYDERDTNKFMTYNSALALIRRLTRKCRINKHLTPYSFRHARATKSAHFLTSAQMNAYFGWTQGSKAPKTYLHLSGVDIEKTLLIQAGLLKPGEEEAGALAVVQCPRCGTVNPREQTLCTKCQSVLSLKAALALEDELKRASKEEIKVLEQKYREQFEIVEKQYLELKRGYEQISEQPEPEWMKEFRQGMKTLGEVAEEQDWKGHFKELGRKATQRMQKEE